MLPRLLVAALLAVATLAPASPAAAETALTITAPETANPNEPFTVRAQIDGAGTASVLYLVVDRGDVADVQVDASVGNCTTERSPSVRYARCELSGGRADATLTVVPSTTAKNAGSVDVRGIVSADDLDEPCTDCGQSFLQDETVRTTLTSSANSPQAQPDAVIEMRDAPVANASQLSASLATDVAVQQGRMTAQDWSDAVGLPVEDFQWSFDDAGTSLLDGPAGQELRVAHIPGNNSSGTGTPINQGVWDLPPKRTYTVSQEVYLEPGWQWGPQATNNQLGKVGGGFLGGAYPSGGTVDTAGFSARPMWLYGAELSAYTYEATRSETYGHQNPSGAELPVGRWFTLQMRVTANSSVSQADGSIQLWLDGDLVLDRQSIQWQSSGSTPMISRYTQVSFHGGSGQQYAPSTTVYARYRNITID